MAAIPNRVIVSTKDVQNITGRSERTARRILTQVRKKNNKPAASLVTIREFCEHTGIKEDIVLPFLI